MTYKRILQIDGLHGPRLIRLYNCKGDAFQYLEQEYLWKDMTFLIDNQSLSFSDDFAIVKFIRNALE